MRCEEIIYEELFYELKEYEKKGVPIVMDGCRASPIQIVEAHLVREVCNYTYMRDYIWDGKGCLAELAFQKIQPIASANYPSFYG